MIRHQASTKSASDTKPFFENLDTLRALSALVVFFFHAGLRTKVESLHPNKFVLYAIQIISSGGWGVSFFFVLSGFLITWLLLTERKVRGKIDIKAFYLRRIFRIWPLYYLVFFIGAILLPFLYRSFHFPLFFDYQLPYYALFLSNFGNLALTLDQAHHLIRSFPLIMTISWSVSIEEQFYLIWPLLFGLLPIKSLKIIVPLFILFSVIAALFIGNNEMQLYWNTAVRLGDIAIGGCFAMLLFHYDRLFYKVVEMPKWVIVTIYVAAIILVLTDINSHVLPLVKYAIRMIVCILFGFIIIEQNFSKNSFFKFGKLKLLDRLGKVSYGIYMLHPIVLFSLGVLMQYMKMPINSFLFIILALLFTLLSAFLSYNFFEMPFLRFKRRFEKIRNQKL